MSPFQVQIFLEYFPFFQQIFSTHLLVDISLLELGIWKKGDNYSIILLLDYGQKVNFVFVFIFMKVKV